MDGLFIEYNVEKNPQDLSCIFFLKPGEKSTYSKNLGNGLFVTY